VLTGINKVMTLVTSSDEAEALVVCENNWNNWVYDAKLKELGDNPTRTQLGRLGEKPERKYTSGST